MKALLALYKFLPEFFIKLYAIFYTAKMSGFNLIRISYNNIGILNYYNMFLSGEYNFLMNILPKFIKDNYNIFFDVGANVGNYSKLLHEAYPSSLIYAFEPNKFAFQKLTSCLQFGQIKCFNLGMGSEVKDIHLYTYKSDEESEHSSIYEDVFTDIHLQNKKNLLILTATISTIDQFCETNGIHIIDFLKIDTEGNDYDVLQGAKKMLKEKKIKVIQFEFNEMNIMSRVFMRDFFKILDEYNLYRLTPKGMLPLGKYSSSYEIFQYQNIVAVNRGVF